MKPAFLLALLLIAFSCSKNPMEEATPHRERADAYLAAGKVREASVEYQSALQKCPDDLDSLYGLAKTLDVLGESFEQLKTLRTLLDKDAKHLEANIALGGYLWAAKNYAGALRHAEVALERNPNSRLALQLKARSLAGLQRTDEARRTWQRFLSAAADLVAEDYCAAAESETWMGNLTGALQLVVDGLQSFPDSAALLLMRGQLLGARGDWAAAKEPLRHALDIDADSPAVQAAWARCLAASGEVTAAEDWLRAAQTRFSDDREKSAEMAIRSGEYWVRKGDLERARDVLESGRERAPDDPKLAAVLSDLLLTLGKTDQALDLLVVAKNADPAGRQAKLLAARAYLQQEHPQWAMRILAGMVAKGDMGVDTHYLYARALALSRRWLMAKVEYGLVLGRDPGHHLARLGYASLLGALGEYASARDQLALLPSSLRTSAAAQILESRIAIATEDIPKARGIALGLIEKSPQDDNFLLLMADVERAAARPERAVEYCEKVLDKTPDHRRAFIAYVEALRAKGESLRIIERVLDEYTVRFGEDSQLLNYWAKMYFSMKMYDQAYAKTDRSLLVDPNNGETRFIRALVNYYAGDIAKASVELSTSIDLNPLEPKAYNMLAEIYVGKGDCSAAENLYIKLLDLVPGEPLASNNLANLYLKQNAAEKALPYAQSAFLSVPGNPHVCDTYGWSLEQCGRSQEANPHLEKAVAALPDNPEVLYHLGVNLISLGEDEAAERCLREVVRFAPDSATGASASELLKKNPVVPSAVGLSQGG